MTEGATTMDPVASGVRALDVRPLQRPGEPAFLADLRRRGADAFAARGLPTPRAEAWRFTNLKDVAATHWTAAPAAAIDPTPWLPADGPVVVVVNGHVRPELSRLDALPEGVSVTTLEPTAADPGGWLEGRLGHGVDLEAHPLAALNTARVTDATLIRVAAGTVLTEPLHVLHVAAGGTEPTVSYPRLLVAVAGGAEATVVERYVSADLGARTLDCPVTELELGPGAVLRHVRLQEESEAATQLGLQQVRLERDATLSSHAVVLGGGLTRTEVDAVLDGEGADCGLDGLYLVDGRRHVDHNVLVRHARPHGSSRQLYKGVLEERARAVFNGRIVVDHGAQRTDARQANRNLLLSDDALVNSNPQLEIFADDVRCTHGSTVGRLDQEAVFYLRSRGIGRAAAESLLTYAFAAEVVQRIPVEAVRERLERHLFDRLPRGEVVREAV